MNTQHRNQIRIIGGSHRGRKIAFPNATGLRPTADSVRERVFNWLGQDLSGKCVLDLFAGSGALGFESASRRAKHVYLVEQQRTVAQQLRRNAELLALPAVEIIAADGLVFLQHAPQRFDVVFLDPPFAWQEWAMLFSRLPSCLNDGALVYLEAGKLPEIPAQWQTEKQGKAGMSHFMLLKYISR
ncbi:16S rRNA (guanine(966)-N(2))-methyltransferase RsmD [Stenoxybacter acetivorans]|uniref:16S rRNA (guanine(966)-N(2))-methyltransferase RsmD n=1 Tax=Stenoxybacter acetivorans TaxID=422441 RepID=UPI00055FA183|nr:16S rRNA (guanine(966)-N(2))-methyltransferase RsmD [Stenoxybacter acetivorans]